MTARAWRALPWVAGLVVLIIVPFTVEDYWLARFCGWMTLAIAALGLNLLTGYNGQISVGHGALYGLGAYATALMINEWELPFLVAVLAGSVLCFAVGVVIGLPALRIKGLYLALVTLAVATLFPQILERFSWLTGGTTGLAITSPQPYRGRIRDRPITFQAPEWAGGLSEDQWRYLMFLAVVLVCFVITANVVRSRVGRSMVAIRDNEIAAEVNGINVASVKVFTFGLSSALAGVGGGLLALNNGRVSSGSFGLAVSLYFLVAVVIGGPATIVGPALGAVTYGVFENVIKPELPEDLQPATPLILGALLIISVLVAPGGVVGTFRQLQSTVRAKRSGHRAPVTAG